MKINAIQSDLRFKSLYNNKLFLSGLEKISENSATFETSVACLSAVFLRPLAIKSTPDTKKENKNILFSESVASSITKFLVAESIILPIEKTIKKIDLNPDRYLKKTTIENFSLKKSELSKTKKYQFVTQLIKQGANLLASIPKSVATVILLPFIFKLFNSDKKDKVSTLNVSLEKEKNNKIFSPFVNQFSFKGRIENKLTSSIAKIIDNKKMQKFAERHIKSDKEVAKNASILNDIVLTLTSILATKKSKNINEDSKDLLITNKILNTTMSIGLGYSVDKIIQMAGKSFVENFVKANKNNPKLNKYIEGMNILRPTVVFALLYYGIIPIISTFSSEKIAKNVSDGNKNKISQK